MLSAVLIREIADLAMQDGASHEDLVALAKAGSWGLHPANCHRQIMGHFCSDVQICQSFEVPVECVDSKTSKESVVDASIFLPHMMFAKLGEMFSAFFHSLFCLGKGNLEKFWQGVQASGDDKLVNHPMTLEKGWEECCIPLFLHGDGVEFQSRDSLMTFSWGSLLSDKTSLESHLLLGAYPKLSTSKNTWSGMWKWFRWSFQALQAGKHPTLDPDNKPLEKGSPWYQYQGQLLHPKGFKGIIWCVIGDQDFHVNALSLPHWASYTPCWECDAQRGDDCALGKRFKQISLEKLDIYVYSHNEHLDDQWSDHPLFQVPHVSPKHVRGDPLHILWCSGIYNHLIGGILHYACYIEGFGKRCAKQPWERLALIFSEVQVEYTEKRTVSRLTNLRLSMLTDPKNHGASGPHWNAKGEKLSTSCQH